MKINISPYLFIVIFPGLLLFACNNVEPKNPEIQYMNKTLKHNEMSTESNVFLESTITEIPPMRLIASPTPSLVPTLSNQQADEFVIKRLVDNGICQFPCIWGISPGFNSIKMARKNLEFVGFYFENIKGIDYGTKVIEESDIKINFGLYSPTVDIQRLYIAINSTNYLSFVRFYSFDETIKTLGRPTKVFINVGISSKIKPPVETSFNIILFYKNINTVIMYDGTSYKKGEIYLVCPAKPDFESKVVKKSSGDVKIFTAEKGVNLTPQEIVSPFWKIPSYYVSTYDAFGLNEEEFYKFAIAHPGEACFETTVENWKR